MGALMRAHDWRASPLGSPETWPQSLRTMVAACLNSPILTTVLWGPDLRMLYNDGYIPSLADRHPRALGEPVAAVWGSAWDVVAPKFHSVLETGRGVSDSNVRLVIQRRGQTEETYWNFSVTPIRGEDGSIAGLLNMGTEITEQVRAERQLKAEREQFARLFEQAPTFMALLTGPDHRIELANPGYQQLIGHRPVLGRTVEEALPDAVQQGYLTLLDEVYGSGKAYSATGAKYAVQPVPGGPSVERFVDFVFQPIVDAAGQVTGVFVEGVDVTARALADAALSRGEARNRQILDSAIDYAIVATDLDGRVTRWNEGARRILGWTEAEMLGQTTARFFTPEDIARGRMQTEMLSALETGRGMDERWHIRRNGERFWSLGEMTALKEEDGTIVGFVKVLRDRTEQRLAQEAKRLSEVRLASALEIAQLGTFDWNMVTGEIGLCDRSREIFGFGETERLREGDLLRRINPAEASRVARQVEQALASQQRLETEYSIVLPDGTVRYVLSIGDPIVTESGNVEGMFGVFGDITDRKRSEAALLELNETLERRIAAALAEREAVEEALRQSQKMEAVGQLTGGLAHDFNNLLTGITGSLELLQTRIAQGRIEDVDRYVNAAQGAAKRAAALTHRLLAFSRRQTLDPKPTDVNRLVTAWRSWSAHGRPGDRRASRRRRGLWTALVDPEPARERAAQPVHQRPRRHAGRRQAHHRDRQPLARRAAGAARPAAGPVRLAVRVRHRHRHAARRDRQGVRPVLHHQADRPGHRAGPVDDLRLRPPVRRAGADPLRGGPGHDGVPLPAPPSRRGGGGRRRPTWPTRPAPSRARRCWWWTTSPPCACW